MKKLIMLLTLIAFTVYSSYASGYSHAKPLIIYYADTDNDGYGDASNSINASSPPSGYVENSDDCNDADASVNPGATEVCNGIDDNCNGIVDEGVIRTWCVDLDGDGWMGYVTVDACDPPYGWIYVTNECPSGYGGDCNDFDSYIIDCEGEGCNGIDDNGNGLIDDEDPGLIGAMIWYADEDGDGWGDPNTSLLSCTQPAGYLPFPNNIDCNDSNASVHPFALEICNGIDDNCDGVPDPEICNSIDTDCDGVPDNFDVCPGGDDSVDYNGDNIPDCSQLLNYNDYSPAWHCDNNKIYVCHNDNNPHTICVDANSLLPAHYDHGDKIGPCTSCAQNIIKPGVNGSPIAIGIAERAEQEIDASSMTIFPNPAGKEVTFHLHGFKDEGVELTLFDYSGKAVWQTIIEHGRYKLRLDLSGNDFANGVYIVKAGSAGKLLTGQLVVFR